MAVARALALPILIVDDERAILASYDVTLRMAGFGKTATLADSREVLPFLEQNGVSIVLLDLAMPHMSGEILLPQITQTYPAVPVVVITGTDRLEVAVQCMKDGAFDFLAKPVERERLIATVRQALTFAEMNLETSSLKQRLLSGELESPGAFAAIITNNPGMQAIFRYVEAIAGSSQPVLITGETGVGKELLARAVHDASGRSGDFVAVNVSGLDESTFSDTLFGHKRGAFTGADSARKGLVERAAGGTLFLDEIGDLAPASQVKLLRLLQEGEYLPLGADTPRRTDARAVVATNSDLDRLQQEGRFRKDLFYRLATHAIHIPALRERADDIPLLLGHFLSEAALELGKAGLQAPRDLPLLLCSYPFPGNVRELRALVFDAASRSRSATLSLESFKGKISSNLQPDSGAPSTATMATTGKLRFGATLPSIEEAKDLLIEETLRRTGGNKSQAAQILGMTRQSLNRRMKDRDGAS
jgi:DNA-binding NtrC family response regulator